MTSDSKQNKKNREYFKSRSIAGGIILLIVGLIILIFSVPSFFVVPLIIGLVLLGLGVLIIYYVRSKNVSDRVYDAAVYNEIEKVKTKAFDILNIDPEQVNLIPPIFIHQYTDEQLSMPVCWKLSKSDEKIRTSNIECMALFFSEQQIYCYYEQFSMIGNEDYIDTKEFFYSDIDSIEIEKSNVRLSASEEKEGKRFARLSRINSFSGLLERFTITSFSGTHYSLTLKKYISKALQSKKYKSQRDRERAFEKKSAIAEAEIQEIDRILRGVINVWRQKKFEH